MSLVSVELPKDELAHLRNRFADRRQVAVRSRLKDEERAAAVKVYQAILRNIDRQGLVDTGKYRASWSIDSSTGAGTRVSTKHPAARRLEYGFVGLDSLGRMYHQAARPHVRPAMIEARDVVRRDFESALHQELEK